MAAQAFSVTVAGGGFSVVGVSRLLISMPSRCRADSRARDLQELQYSVLSTQYSVAVSSVLVAPGLSCFSA